MLRIFLLAFMLLSFTQAMEHPSQKTDGNNEGNLTFPHLSELPDECVMVVLNQAILLKEEENSKAPYVTIGRFRQTCKWANQIIVEFHKNPSFLFPIQLSAIQDLTAYLQTDKPRTNLKICLPLHRQEDKDIVEQLSAVETSKLMNLTTLDLSGTYCNFDSLVAFLKAASQLTNLNLTSCCLSASNTISLLSASYCTNLTTLRLGSTSVKLPVLNNPSFLWQNLTCLNLDTTGWLTDELLTKLFTSPNFALINLSLVGNKLKGIPTGIINPCLHTLKKLNLSGNPEILPMSYATLKKWRDQFPSLTKLYLKNVIIPAVLGASALKQMKKKNPLLTVITSDETFNQELEEIKVKMLNMDKSAR